MNEAFVFVSNSKSDLIPIRRSTSQSDSNLSSCMHTLHRQYLFIKQNTALCLFPSFSCALFHCSAPREPLQACSTHGHITTHSTSCDHYIQFPLVNSALANSDFILIQCVCLATNHAKALNSSIDISAFTITQPKTVRSKVTE
jgi:hypothetical protein